MSTVDINQCRQLFEKWSGEPCLEYEVLKANGSNRVYCRIVGETRRCVGAINADVRENEAFFYFSNQFCGQGLRVPVVYAISDDRTCYIQQDLGDLTLFEWLNEHRGLNDWEGIERMYERVLKDLVQFQLQGERLNFEYSYPRAGFDRQSMQWDLNYFKYYYLKLAYVPFDEQLLEVDYCALMDYLLEEDCGGFMYRDFQSRNIMLVDDELYYIDFQGGREGAYQYDVASLLFSAKTNLPLMVRERLLEFYINELSLYKAIDKERFRSKFYGYVLLRIMQALGAYGYRGYFERKDYFLSSVPLAINNIRYILEEHPLPIHVPHLQGVLEYICRGAVKEDLVATDLTVMVSSFSYRRGLPLDDSGNGGGFVFDCRALHNPGRYDEYKSLTGLDDEVKIFLQKEKGVDKFLVNIEDLVGQSVDKYIERGFTNLMVSFGCTGGQHRSVYCAERLSEWLRRKYPNVAVVTEHRERENWPQKCK